MKIKVIYLKIVLLVPTLSMINGKSRDEVPMGKPMSEHATTKMILEGRGNSYLTNGHLGKCINDKYQADNDLALEECFGRGRGDLRWEEKPRFAKCLLDANDCNADSLLEVGVEIGVNDGKRCGHCLNVKDWKSWKLQKERIEVATLLTFFDVCTTATNFTGW